MRDDLLGVAQVENVVIVPYALSQGKFYCFIPHELELSQAVQVGEDLLGVAQVVGEDVVIVAHTLTQGKFIVLSLTSLKVLSNGKRGGLKVVAFDKSPFKLFTLRFSNKSVQAPSCKRPTTTQPTLFLSFETNNCFPITV